MPSYTKPTVATMLTSIRRQLADATGRWWSDAQLIDYLEDWQTDLNNKYEFSVGTATTTMSGASVTLPSDCQRVLWVIGSSTNGVPYTIPPTSESVLSRVSSEWRFEWGYEPGAWVQTTDTALEVWPAQLGPTELRIEYTKKFYLPTTTSTIGVPAYCIWHGVAEVMRRAYLALGPNYDLNRSLRWKARASRWDAKISRIQNSRWGATKYPSLKPATTQWEAHIVRPSSTISELHMPSIIATGVFDSVSISGSVDGVNATFTTPTTYDILLVYVNGVLQRAGTHYTISGTTLTFTSGFIPATGDWLAGYSWNI